MRFKLNLEVKETGEQLPLNYQYGFSSWIYKTIHFGNPAFAEWLHSHGYMDGHKQFRLFTFSGCYPEKYEIKGDRMVLLSNNALFYISFFTEEAAAPFITGLFSKQQFSIGDKISSAHFRVNSIEKLPDPQWKETMSFYAQSPVVISMKRENNPGHAAYLSPDADNYGELLIKNLVNKYLALISNRKGTEKMTFLSDSKTKFTFAGQPKSRLVKIKAGTKDETSVKGYLFDFTITAPVELIKLGYYAGFGEKNSMGFGYAEII